MNVGSERNGPWEDLTGEVRILLAMEDAISADLLGDRLDKKGLRTTRVDNGVDALRRVRDESFDLVVAETRLSGRTGFELLNDLPSVDLAVVLIGKQDNDAEVIRALKLGATEYITVPFNPEVVVVRLLRLLRPDLIGVESNGQNGAGRPVLAR